MPVIPGKPSMKSLLTLRASALHALAGALLIFTIPAPAPRAYWGPPMVCFQFDIGDAPSLPWGPLPATPDGDAFVTDPNYSEGRLIGDTLQILDSSSDTLVHMETIRRASIYAARFDSRPAKGREGSLATRLIITIMDRAFKQSANHANHALPWIDAGFAVGAAQHMSASLGRYISWTEYFIKALAIAPGDAAASLAAASAHLDGLEAGKWREFLESAARAAKPGSLIFKNVARFAERYPGAEKAVELLKISEAAATSRPAK